MAWFTWFRKNKAPSQEEVTEMETIKARLLHYPFFVTNTEVPNLVTYSALQENPADWQARFRRVERYKNSFWFTKLYLKWWYPEYKNIEQDTLTHEVVSLASIPSETLAKRKREINVLETKVQERMVTGFTTFCTSVEKQREELERDGTKRLEKK